MIHDVSVTSLRRIPDDRGCVFHMLKSTDAQFRAFGEIYFSSAYPGVVKGWHSHERMTINYACIVGNIKMVLFDDRAGSPSKGTLQVIYLGNRNYSLVTVPPGIWNGFQNVDVIESIVANCSDIPHDPGEIKRLNPHGSHIPFDWSRRDG